MSASPRVRPSSSGSRSMSSLRTELQQPSRRSGRPRSFRSSFRLRAIRSAAACSLHLARPGGNVTGLSNQGGDLGGKKLGLLREVLPTLTRVAVMVNADYSGGVTEMIEIDTAARTLGVEIVPLTIRRAEDIAPAFDGLKERVEALYVIGDPLVSLLQLRINTFALAARLPTMGFQREYVEAAGLISYGTNFPDQHRRAAEFVDKILRGARPADLPVEPPTKYELVINLTTAKALGLEVPPTLLARADEVIE